MKGNTVDDQEFISTFNVLCLKTLIEMHKDERTMKSMEVDEDFKNLCLALVTVYLKSAERLHSTASQGAAYERYIRKRIFNCGDTNTTI